MIYAFARFHIAVLSEVSKQPSNLCMGFNLIITSINLNFGICDETFSIYYTFINLALTKKLVRFYQELIVS